MDSKQVWLIEEGMNIIRAVKRMQKVQFKNLKIVGMANEK